MVLNDVVARTLFVVTMNLAAVVGFKAQDYVMHEIEDRDGGGVRKMR